MFEISALPSKPARIFLGKVIVFLMQSKVDFTLYRKSVNVPDGNKRGNSSMPLSREFEFETRSSRQDLIPKSYQD